MHQNAKKHVVRESNGAFSWTAAKKKNFYMRAESRPKLKIGVFDDNVTSLLLDIVGYLCHFCGGMLVYQVTDTAFLNISVADDAQTRVGKNQRTAMSRGNTD